MDGYQNNGQPKTAVAASGAHSLAGPVGKSLAVALNEQAKLAVLTENLYARDQVFDQSYHLHVNSVPPVKPSNETSRRKKKFSTLPAINPHFVYIGDRHKALIGTLTQELIRHQRIAIHGLIGTGKWEMALQVAHSILSSKDVAINHSFCVAASNTSTFERDYASIAGKVGIRYKSTKSVDCKLEDVKVWLQNAENGKWVLVLDGIDISIIRTGNYEGQVEGEASDYNSLGKYLPQLANHGYMILTTDDENVALHFLNPRQKPVKVPSLDQDEAVELLGSRLTDDSVWTDNASSREDARRLVSRLDNHPSAIILAAAYINRHYEGGETISSYVKKLASDRNLEILSEDSYSSLNGYGFPHNPVRAWRISFTKIKSECPQAIEVLALMSCLDQTLIPMSLLECCRPLVDRLWKHLEMLRQLSFINTNDKGKTYQMSRLLQVTAHAWLHDQGERAKSQVSALMILFEQYNKIQQQSHNTGIPAYVKQRQLLPHIDVFEQYCRKNGVPVDSMAEIAPALVSFANLYAGEGRYGPAQRLLCYVRDHFHKKDIWRIFALRDLAETIRSQPPTTSETREARSESLKIARDILRKARCIAQDIEDRDAEIDIFSSLALNYSDVGHLKPAEAFQTDIKRHFKLAEEFQKEVIVHKATPHAGSQIETVSAILGLSKIHFRRGRNVLEVSDGKQESISKAQKDLKRAESAQSKLLTRMEGETVKFPGDTERASLLNDIRAALARSHFSLGKFEEAEEQARAAYEGRLALFGQYDIKTLGIEEDLCACLMERGQVGEAETRLQSVLERLMEKFGKSGYLVGRCERKLRDLAARKELVV